MEQVSIRIKESGKVVRLSRPIAENWVKRQPNDYELISAPKIEVTKLEPLQPKEEKKSAEVAASVLNEPKVEVKEQKAESKKIGRPKKSV